MKRLLFIMLLFSLISCSSFKNISNNVSISKTSKIVVIPLINNSETPMSGFKAKNIIENELISKNLNISITEFYTEGDNITEKDLKDFFDLLKTKNIDYAFYGYINEWRYKAGVDSEPAVSLTINLYDLKNDKIVWSASASKTASSYKSIGIISQKLIKKMISEINVK